MTLHRQPTKPNYLRQISFTIQHTTAITTTQDKTLATQDKNNDNKKANSKQLGFDLILISLVGT